MIMRPDSYQAFSSRAKVGWTALQPHLPFKGLQAGLRWRSNRDFRIQSGLWQPHRDPRGCKLRALPSSPLKSEAASSLVSRCMGDSDRSPCVAHQNFATASCDNRFHVACVSFRFNVCIDARGMPGVRARLYGST
jgi:hypothetical protein